MNPEVAGAIAVLREKAFPWDQSASEHVAADYVLLLGVEKRAAGQSGSV